MAPAPAPPESQPLLGGNQAARRTAPGGIHQPTQPGGMQPTPAASDMAWEQREAADPENPGQRKACFYNAVTGESRWERPGGQELSWRGRLRNLRTKGGEEHMGIWGEAALAVAPWSLFVITSMMYSFFWHGSSGILSVLTVLGLLLLLLRFLMASGFSDVKIFGKKLGRPPLPRHGPNASAWAHPRFFLSCIVGVIAGSMVGYYNYNSYVADYWSFFEHWHYTNVWPEEPAAAHRDASAIVFAEGARPDASQSAVYTVGHHSYCAAPISMTGQGGGANVQYFAVGMDCCSRQPVGFTCGAAGNDNARAGLVIYNRTNFYDFLIANDYEFYLKAAEISTARFQLASTTKPIFLRWTTDIEWENMRIVWNAWRFLLLVAVVALPLLVVLELGIARASAIARQGYGKARKGHEHTSREAADARRSAAGQSGLPPPVVFHPANDGHAAGRPAAFR